MSNNRHSQNTTLREEKTIPCNCGQNTHLIRLPDGWHYHKIHGTNESLSNGRCSNCRAPLDMSLAVDIFIVPNHPYWTDQERIFQEDKVWYEATPDEITTIRKKVPGWTPDNPQWSEVKAKLLKISNSSIRFADCKDMKFGDIAAIFRNESDAQKPAETEQNATPAKKEKGDVNVNIFGPFQAGKLQIAQDASIHEQSIIKEQKKGIIRKVLKIVGAIIVGIIASLLADILCGFGWFGRIKHLFTR